MPRSNNNSGYDRRARGTSDSQRRKEIDDLAAQLGIQREDWRAGLEGTHVESKKVESRGQSFRESLAVPTTQRTTQTDLMRQYPKDAVIIAMGPASNGKTEKMKELFGEDSVYSFNEMMYQRENEPAEKDDGKRKKGDVKTKRQKQEIKEEFFAIIEKIIEDADGPIVIDINTFKEEFRKRLYELIKQAGKTVFFVMYSIPIGEASKRIDKKFAEKIAELEEEIEAAKAKGENTIALDKKLKDLRAAKKKRKLGLKATYDEFLGLDYGLSKELDENGMTDSRYPSQVKRIKDKIHIADQTKPGNEVR